MIRVYKTGAHAHRTPLSYPALAPLFDPEILLVDQPDTADIYLFAHVLDIQTAEHDLIESWRRRQVPIVLLSEEPFWDTIWGQHPLNDILIVETAFGPLPVHQLNHHTSSIFQFDRIPYYLLTNLRFAKAYQERFTRNAKLSAEKWQVAFSSREKEISFMFERRPESFHWVEWPQASLIGLCSWRTEMAEACTGPNIERLGRTWDGSAKRQNLPDWHKDKLAYLDGRARYIGAYENTHQPNYITEKFFDAFACGALPLYYAAPNHRIHELGLPAETWINSYGMSAAQAAIAITKHQITPSVCAAYVTAQQILADLFTRSGSFEEERTHLRQATVRELKRVMA
jgi:hypothetical protein